MGLRINTNILSLNAQRNLSNTQRNLSRSLERLSSGSRINRAGDDPAGLSISEGLGNQARGIAVAMQNANNALGFLNTAEGAMGELSNITQRLKEIGIQAANGTLGASDRSYLNLEKGQLLQEFQRIATQANFNGTNLLDGSFGTSTLQVGTTAIETISFNLGDARASTLGSLATKSGTQNSLTATTANLVINGTAIGVGQTTDDTVSSSGNSFSAIAVAKEVNALAGTTKVYADIQATNVQLNNLDFSGFSAGTLGSSGANSFLLNGVVLQGTGITNVNSFITLVNNNAAATGVSAKLQSGSTSSVTLYANDGRNIEANLGTYAGSTYSAGSNFIDVFTFSNTNYQSNGGIFSASFSTTGFTANLSAAFGAANADELQTGAIRLRSSSNIVVTGTGVSTAIGYSASTISVNTASAVNAIDVSTQTNASNSLAVLDATLNQLNNLRAGIGATQSRLNSTINTLGITLENISSAKSVIRDTDIASTTAELTKNQILNQAGVAVLGQANNSSEIALQLLKF